jgi:hypothetical protein
MPTLGGNWGPRVSLAVGRAKRYLSLLRVGYGMYFARVPNGPLMAALTQTGSANGDLNFFMRPTDNLNAGGAPPFPYVFAGEPLTMVKPGAVEFAPGFRNPEIHQAIAGIQESLPGHFALTANVGEPWTPFANLNPNEFRSARESVDHYVCSGRWHGQRAYQGDTTHCSVLFGLGSA